MPVINQFDMSRLYTAVLLSLFDDIQLTRRDALNPYTVPIMFADRSRLYKKLYRVDTSDTTGVNYSLNLPAMALTFNGFNPALERQTNKLLRKKIATVDENNVTVNWNDVATDFSYNLLLVGKSLTEMTNIAEYIVSTFKNQIYYVNTLTPLYQSPVSTPIILNTVDVNIDSNENEYSDDRLLECSFDITVQGILHNNVKSTSRIINEVQLNMYMETELQNILQSFQVTE